MPHPGFFKIIPLFSLDGLSRGTDLPVMIGLCVIKILRGEKEEP